jgi:hypothetical protein
MSKDVRGDPFALQRGALQAGGADVLCQKVLDRIAAELSPSDARKERVCELAMLFPKPSSQYRHGFLAKGCAPFLPSLTLASDVRATAKNDVLAAKFHQLRDPQP